MSDSDEENYVNFGTPLDPLDEGLYFFNYLFIYF